MAFGPFSLLPLGLPNMFGLTGQAMPKTYLEDVRLGLDLLTFLAPPNCQELLTPFGSINAVGLHGSAVLRVPENQAWLVHGYSVAAVTLAGEHIRMRPVVAKTLAAGNIVQRVIGEEDTTDLADQPAAGIARCGIDKPIIVWAGEQLGASVSRLTTAGTVDLFFQASIFRFTV